MYVSYDERLTHLLFFEITCIQAVQVFLSTFLRYINNTAQLAKYLKSFYSTLSRSDTQFNYLVYLNSIPCLSL